MAEVKTEGPRVEVGAVPAEVDNDDSDDDEPRLKIVVEAAAAAGAPSPKEGNSTSSSLSSTLHHPFPSAAAAASRVVKANDVGGGAVSQLEARGDPKQQQQQHNKLETEADASAAAIESLLMLGRGAVFSQNSPSTASEQQLHRNPLNNSNNTKVIEISSGSKKINVNMSPSPINRRCSSEALDFRTAVLTPNPSLASPCSSSTSSISPPIFPKIPSILLDNHRINLGSGQFKLGGGGGRPPPVEPEKNLATGAVTYYQRMRERNNEASKRCRLKRRLKAESLESQCSQLSMCNRLMRARIARMEEIGQLFQSGVQRIRDGQGCQCAETVSQIKQVNRACEDDGQDRPEMSNRDLICLSEQSRIACIESAVVSSTTASTLAMMGSSAEEDNNGSSSSTTVQSAPVSPLPVMTFPGRSELSVTPVNPITALTPPSPLPTQLSRTAPPYIKVEKPFAFPPKPKTALDVINDTIVKSLKSTSNPTSPASSPQPQIQPHLPLNLVKLVKPPTLNESVPVPISPINNGKPPIIVLTSPSSPTSAASAILKNRRHSLSQPLDLGVVKTAGGEICAAASHFPEVSCNKGDLVNINKLTSNLHLITKTPVKEETNGSAAAERAILKSRLGIPFWRADDDPTFICSRHRNFIVSSADLLTCALCNKKKASTQSSSPPSSPKKNPVMMTVTYRMSLANHMNNGKILPIGLVVCGSCREKQLKGVDCSDAQIVTPLHNNSCNGDDNPNAFTSQGINKELITNNANGSISSTEQVSQSILSTSSPSPSNSTPLHISKVARLNEALQAINHDYKPIGFAITSIDSCSESVLRDAASATETAVLTLMSVIAPGQEHHLWEKIKPKLDSKFKDADVKLKSQSEVNGNDDGEEAPPTKMQKKHE